MTSFRSILVPYDFSPHADAALDLAIEVGRLAKSRIVLVHVFRLPIEMLSPYEIQIPEKLADDVRAAASTRLERALERVRGAGLKGIAEVDSGSIAETIVARAAADAVDLIVMGTRGLSGIQHVVLGSVAERVLRTAPCPVMTLRALDPA